MRILFLIDNLRPGGAQKALLSLCRALKSTRAEPVVWCLGGTSPFEEEFEAIGVPVLGKPRSFLTTLLEPISLFRYLRREEICLVQTLLFHSDVTGRAAGWAARLLQRRRRVPVITSSVRASNIRNRWWQFLLLRLTAPLADAFTAVSSRTLEFAARHEGVARERTRLIPNGIDVSEWDVQSEAESARAELDLPPNAFVISTVGRLHEQKGHEYLLLAARELCAQEKDAIFLIAGYGPLRKHLEARTGELGIASRVRFLGYRKDVKRILAASDVFALPSLWEGMSNAILEAMAAGKPVVATAVDGNVEQVVHGETGLLAPPADSDALAKAFLELARDRRRAREMGDRGRERARRNFPVERMTGAHIELYAKLLKEKAGIEPATWR